MTKSPPKNAAKTVQPKGAMPPVSTNHRNHPGTLPEYTFVEGHHSRDVLAEEMAEDAVRAITSGEDETVSERGDGLAPNLSGMVDRALEKADLDEPTPDEFDEVQ